MASILAVLGALFVGFRMCSDGLLVKQYSCDNVILSWCQLHNVTIGSDFDLQMVAFPKHQMIGFLNGSVLHFSHLLNIRLFKAGAFRLFARGTRINRLTLPNTVEQLYFRDNGIQTVEIDGRASYAMKYLRLQINRIRDISNFKPLKNLVELDLCSNLLEHLSLDTFFGMAYLKQLILCDNRLKSITASANIQLYHLYHLDLSSNFLFNQTALQHWDFPRLGNVSLRDNLLTTLDVGIVSQRFTALKILDLEHNSLDCDTYRQLLQLVHRRKIIYNVDKRVCAGTSNDNPVSLSPRFGPPESSENGYSLEVRQLKQRLYQQVQIINRQRAEIEQLRANLTTLMEQFDLVAGPARANDPF
ncbi:insulin-like growth factor-binding protein complex acid labile subunit [Uranotaenia lowii]|uniref:insulin-like growth factor-binding protein complex acid labile subunit n=1 Tax=Uranotaenia lowii TaxID=190385 RepID=UPI00247904AD|nr:insulin-like growth factor-binding protein complex acid labile subunit [Uranotaenia lowii]